MSGPGRKDAASDMLIIRRGKGGGDEGHHGGVWKIAYADFMTAMMAFFLVMWLINAANEETRSQVAQYFNPIKLVDKVASDKGIKRPQTGAAGHERLNKMAMVRAEVEGKFLPPNSKPSPSREENLFRDPYAVLSSIASELGKGRGAHEPKPSKATGQGSAGGDAFRDPFDPDYWANLERLEKKEAEEALAKKKETEDKAPERPASKKTKSAKQAKAAETGQAEADRVRKEIETSLQQAHLPKQPDIEVKAGENGLLVSLTDKLNFGMFAVSSARPSPELVHVMQRIAKTLKALDGDLIIRGHTDARPFASKTYDNWRLSSARAHMAYHMLVRGGIDPKRIVRIEGHADRDLKDKKNPNAGSNRRIEIFIRKPRK